MEQGQLNWIANLIYSIADDILRDLYVRGRYRDVILPMIVMHRLGAVLRTRGDLDGAELMYRKSLETAERLGSPSRINRIKSLLNSLR